MPREDSEIVQLRAEVAALGAEWAETQLQGATIEEEKRKYREFLAWMTEKTKRGDNAARRQ